MADLLGGLFSSGGFMPHGHCYTWHASVLWLNVASDAVIAAAYYSIPIALGYFVHRRGDLPFPSLFLLFAVFILACGTTHVLAVVTVWDPVYRLSGVVKAGTALVSVAAAIVLVRVLPQALALPSPDELRRLNEELEATRAALADRVDELTVLNRELEGFVHHVSHDLQVPVRHLRGFVPLLVQRPSLQQDPEARELAAYVEEGASKLGSLIEALLRYSRLGRQPLARRPVDLGALVRELRPTFAAEAGDSGVEWVVGDLPTVLGDEATLRVLLINLLSNALKYGRAEGGTRIEIGALPAGKGGANGWTGFYVRDHGVGFDMRHAGKLFGVFERLHREDEFPGNGIGLANARRVVERHGGRIWAESAPGAGATFYVALPA